MRENSAVAASRERRVEVVPGSRFTALPRHKDEVARTAWIRPEAVAEASEDYERVFGAKPSASMKAFAFTGSMQPLRFQGSRLRETTLRDITARFMAGKPLTTRQLFFVREADEWCARASWLAARTLVLNTGRYHGDRGIALEWVYPDGRRG